MSVKAKWHEEDLGVDDTDPFLAYGKQEQLDVDVRDAGKPIRLDDPPALTRELHELMAREAVLAGKGVTCSLKDRSDTTCSVCPVRSTDGTQALSQLCTVGCDQERVLTRLAVARRAEA